MATGARGRRAAAMLGLLVAALVAVTACAADEPAVAEATTTTATPTPSEDPATATSEATTGDTRGVAALLEDGIGLVDPGTGSTTRAALGEPVDAVLRLGDAAFGAPSELVPGCELDVRETHQWPNGFTAYARDGVFIGWTVRPGTPSAELTTVAGIGIGSTRDELLAAYDVEVETTTLGEEFVIGSLAGVLDGAEPTSEVIALWGGDGCVAR